jgi:hypothetical protein
MRDGRLKLKRRDALRISRELHRLRETLRASFPRVRIEDVLTGSPSNGTSSSAWRHR